MKRLTSVLLMGALTFISCKKECRCDAVSYESNVENSYSWTETNRLKSDACEADLVSSTFLDSQGNISYVKTMIECE